MDSPQMKLIYSGRTVDGRARQALTDAHTTGKIMADEKAVEFYNIKESDQIICMAQKVRFHPLH